MTKQKNDEFGERMKAYEFQETARVLNKSLPIYVRIDGRSFSKFTKNMHRPYDIRMSSSMINTTKRLVKETNALMGYTQSDEISLVYLWDKPETDVFFGGKVQKLTSILASMTTAIFNRELLYNFGEFNDGRDLLDKIPHFDARVFNLPSKTEAANAFLWRAMDARKNAISMAAFSMFSPKQLHGKDQVDMKLMMLDKGIDFECHYPDFFKKGSFVRKVTREIPRPFDEIEKIPEAIRPTLPEFVKRSFVEVIPMPEFNKVQNRVSVIFDGAEPDTSKKELCDA
jgi:tRNA(His) guanylyltransferase